MKISYLILIILTIIIVFIFSEDIKNNDFECPRDQPLFNKSNDECVYEYYDENKYLISNNIIKKQWLNRRNVIGIDSAIYMSSDISSQGDLVIVSYPYDKNGISIRFIYGLKSNGRALFYDETKNDFIYQINISTSTIVKFESKLVQINLIGEDKKDYYISSSFSEYAFDMIDIVNKNITTLKVSEIIRPLIPKTKIFSIIKLNNEDKTYLYCCLGINPNNTYYLSLLKLQFYDFDISQKNNYKIINSTTLIDDYRVPRSLILTCNEIMTFNLIQ